MCKLCIIYNYKSCACARYNQKNYVPSDQDCGESLAARQTTATGRQSAAARQATEWGVDGSTAGHGERKFYGEGAWRLPPGRSHERLESRLRHAAFRRRVRGPAPHPAAVPVMIVPAVMRRKRRSGRPQRSTSWGPLGLAPWTSHQLATERRVPAPGATKYSWEMIGRLDWAWAARIVIAQRKHDVPRNGGDVILSLIHI